MCLSSLGFGRVRHIGVAEHCYEYSRITSRICIGKQSELGMKSELRSIALLSDISFDYWSKYLYGPATPGWRARQAGQVKPSTAFVGARALLLHATFFSRATSPEPIYLSIHRNTTRAGHSASHPLSPRRPRILDRSFCIVAGATTNLKEAGSAATTD